LRIATSIFYAFKCDDGIRLVPAQTARLQAPHDAGRTTDTFLLFTRSIVIIGVAPRWRPLPRPEPEMMGLQRIACELPDLFPRIVLQHGAELPLVFATTAKLKLDGAPERVVFSSA
jgi:hypothetical protein